MPERKTLRTVVGWLATLAVLAGVIAYQVIEFDKWKRTVDFVSFYCAANSIRTRSADKLYDADFQMRCQREVASRTELLPPIHPPFEYLIYMPLTYLPLRLAYVSWTLVSFAGLVASVMLLYPCAPAFGGRSGYLAICMCYYPVFTDFISGQDSTLLLLVFVFVFLLLKRGKETAAGCALACGLFKFQLIVPFAVIMFLRRKWRLFSGFLSVTVALTLISVAISGWRVLESYPRILGLEPMTWQISGALPEMMPNVRGLMWLLFGQLLPAGQVRLLVLLLSAGLLYFAVWAWRSIDSPRSECFDLAFSVTIVTSALLSYHLNSHDLTVFLLPIALMANYLSKGSREIAGGHLLKLSLAVLIIPFLHLLLMGNSCEFSFWIKGGERRDSEDIFVSEGILGHFQ